MKRAACLLATLFVSACVDFADPVLPNSGAPAVGQVSISAFENGIFIING